MAQALSPLIPPPQNWRFKPKQFSDGETTINTKFAFLRRGWAWEQRRGLAKIRFLGKRRDKKIIESDCQKLCWSLCRFLQLANSVLGVLGCLNTRTTLSPCPDLVSKLVWRESLTTFADRLLVYTRTALGRCAQIDRPTVLGLLQVSAQVS